MEPNNYKNDRLPLGPMLPPNIEPIKIMLTQPLRVWGEPTPDHERITGRDEVMPGFNNYDPTSPFGTGLPPANPFKRK